jgi:hypothetical protein
MSRLVLVHIVLLEDGDLHRIYPRPRQLDQMLVRQQRALSEHPCTAGVSNIVPQDRACRVRDCPFFESHGTILSIRPAPLAD